MKVLMFGWEFPPFNSGGLGTACFGLTRGLSRKNVEVIFVLPKKVDVEADFLKFIFGDETSPNKYIINSLLDAYITSEIYAGRVSIEDAKRRAMYGASLFDEVMRYGSIGGDIARTENFDIIHAHDWLTFPAAIEAKKVSGKGLVVHIHATEFDRGGGNGVNQEVYKIEKKGMEEADVVITVSGFTKQKVMENYGIPENKIKVVHNAIDYENYALNEIHNLKKTHKIVLFLGRVTLQKGPDYFVYTAKKVLEHYKDVIFVVAGSGDMEKMIIKKVAELNMADKFIFAGWLRGNDTAKAYQMADLFVMPSVSEPFGLTPLESLIQGTPVLISNQSGVSEVLNHCLKTDFWDIDEMANKIVSVLRYDELKRCLSNNGRDEVKKLSWDKPAESCLDIYDEIIRRKE